MKINVPLKIVYAQASSHLLLINAATDISLKTELESSLMDLSRSCVVEKIDRISHQHQSCICSYCTTRQPLDLSCFRTVSISDAESGVQFS